MLPAAARGKERCGNMLKNILTQFLYGLIRGKFVGKTCSFSKNSGPSERKRPGRVGLNIKKSRKDSPANHIIVAEINLVFKNIMHWDLCVCRCVPESYLHTCSMQVTALGFSPQPSHPTYCVSLLSCAFSREA